MGIEWWRDLVIIVMGIFSIGFLVLLSIIVFSLYRRVKSIQNSVLKTLSVIEASSEILKSTIQASTAVFGMRSVLCSVADIFKKNRRENQ